MKAKIRVILKHFHNRLWSYYVAVPKEIGDRFVEGSHRRVLCAINGRAPIHSALMPKGEEYTIYVTNKLQKELAIEEGDELTITLEKDTSEYGFPMPESLEILLSQDEEGRNYFESLTKGRQRSLIYLVQKVKNVDSQLAKGLAILHHLKEAKGVLDFKRLNVWIKEYNSRNKKVGYSS